MVSLLNTFNILYLIELHFRKVLKDWTEGSSFFGNFELVFRKDCRSIDGSLESFLENQVPKGHAMWSNTFSMEKQFKHFRVLWILDGYDEKSSRFVEFYRSLQNHF